MCKELLCLLEAFQRGCKRRLQVWIEFFKRWDDLMTDEVTVIVGLGVGAILFPREPASVCVGGDG